MRSKMGKAVVFVSTALLIFAIFSIQAQAFPTDLDLSTEEGAAYSDTLYGANKAWKHGDLAGTSMLTTDLDGDGYEDLVVGAPQGASENDTRIDCGYVSILFGSESGYESWSADLGAAYTRVYGNTSAQRFGFSLASADWNGDGIQDLAIGAPGTGVIEPNTYFVKEGSENSGAVYIILGGSRTKFSNSHHISEISDYWYQGAARNQQLGYNLVSGDIDGDSKQDLMIAAIEQDPDTMGTRWGGAGKVYGLLGKDLPVSGEYTSNNLSFFLSGNSLGECLGYSLAIGDLNKDGYDDIAMGAPYYAPTLSAKETGRVYVVYGKQAWNDTTLSNPGHLIDGVDANGFFGAEVAIGDLDLDNQLDLVISAPKKAASTFTEAGQVFVFLSPLSEDDKLIHHADFTLIGSGTNDHAGTGVDFVSFQSTPYLAVGATQSNGSLDKGYHMGEVYLIECRADRQTGISTLSESASHTIYGQHDSEAFGAIMITGNVGKAKQETLIIAAPEHDGADQSRANSGGVYFIRETPKYIPPPVVNETEDNLTVPSGIQAWQVSLLVLVGVALFCGYVGFVAYKYKKKH